MSFIPIASYYVNNGANIYGPSNSCWPVDSTYIANTPLFGFGAAPLGDSYWGNTLCSGFDFSLGGFSNWFDNINLPWGNSFKTTDKKKSNPFSPSGSNGLLSATEWDAQIRGKIKSVKRCNEDYISELQPKMQEKVHKLMEFAKKNGIPFNISSGYRTRDKQISLRNRYGSSRAASADGSRHRSGCAIDISVNNLTEAQTTKLGKYAESIGMRWGGRWGGSGSSTIRERWHFDLSA